MTSITSFQFSFQSVGGTSLVWALAWGIALGRSCPSRKTPSTTSKTCKQLNRALSGFFFSQKYCNFSAKNMPWSSNWLTRGCPDANHDARGAAGPWIRPQPLDETDPLPTLAMCWASWTSKLLCGLPKASGQGQLFGHRGCAGSGAGGLGDAFAGTERRWGKWDTAMALHVLLCFKHSLQEGGI